MKAISVFLGFFLIALSAHASDVLARYEYNSGYSPKPGSESVTIHDDGSVIFQSDYVSPQDGVRISRRNTIAQLSKDRVKALKGEILDIKPGDLVDKQAGQPGCADAPSTRYTVISGEEIVIAQEMGCHTWVNDTPSAQAVRKLLEGLGALSKM